MIICTPADWTRIVSRLWATSRIDGWGGCSYVPASGWSALNLSADDWSLADRAAISLANNVTRKWDVLIDRWGSWFRICFCSARFLRFLKVDFNFCEKLQRVFNFKGLSKSANALCMDFWKLPHKSVQLMFLFPSVSTRGRQNGSNSALSTDLWPGFVRTAL